MITTEMWEEVFDKQLKMIQKVAPFVFYKHKE